ncbi:cyclic nucleotide-binding protein [Herbaspirillum rubrisubalbicans]|jgi:CRP-like cAMP-binding protein|uniref:Crp/Fnr family transcriptional regulator n=1 Tax=Herbaspirillum rubrisubalbicans Os34 TaxID=1235827 RepID=A0A6M3ZXU3_9BURK|nr:MULTISPECIES: Crp/Fnr family transcriptional regulator [Herbaspirillum]MCP1574942.1 CRP-like cAMP-binding protein [Herbaspirillum rubrisubalbicans]NQE49640.1 cyclic nucleotide-binding protein [Herbaspirillum rubrisubalbicans]QJQ03464.1 Crp/Fnr family transcriptional regulator [Herbaspirillum rubrisubalbicans Os34]RAN44876.1 cyclic nucleotide-binding protein [Herbaspirillum rubrisubalbicans]
MLHTEGRGHHRKGTNSRREQSGASLESALRQATWYAQLDDAVQASILAQAREITLEAGSYLFGAGEQPRGWYGVIEGLLTWKALDEDGRSLSMAGFSAGSWFGEASVIRAKPYEYHVAALRYSRLVLIPADTCDTLFRHHHAFSNAVMRHLAERVNFFMAMFAAHVLADMEVKIARILASMFDKELHPRTQPHLHINQEELANLCGVSRQRCNAVLKSLSQAGLIAVEYSGVTVLDLEGLRHHGPSARLGR